MVETLVRKSNAHMRRRQNILDHDEKKKIYKIARFSK